MTYQKRLYVHPFAHFAFFFIKSVGQYCCFVNTAALYPDIICRHKRSYQNWYPKLVFSEQPNQESSHLFLIHEFIFNTQDNICTDKSIFWWVSYFTHLYFQNIPYLASHTKEKWENNRERHKLVLSSIFEYCWCGMTLFYFIRFQMHKANHIFVLYIFIL